MKCRLKSLIFLFSLLIALTGCKGQEDVQKIRYKGIERTLTLLNSSSKNSPQDLDILFYGQSIIGGMKTSILVDSLKSRFPHTNITFKHKPIGGFTIPSLVKTAEHDVYQENADLIIFHAYGGIKDGLYDTLIKRIRQRTSSDILLLNHHYVWDIPKERLEKVNRSHENDSKEIEKIAKKYHCGFVDVRNHWAKYLKDNGLGANELMGNKVDPNVHPNDQGNFLLRKILLEKLTSNKRFEYTHKKDSLRHKTILKDINKEITLEFEGNRLELITSSKSNEALLEILIDGKKPSEFKDSYYITRPSKGFYGWMPALKNVSLGSEFPREERWTITLFDINREFNTFKYKVEGNKTGFDGKGHSEKDFISNSKRIKLNKDDFYIFEIESISKKETPENFKINFDIKQIGNDTLAIKEEQRKYIIFRGTDSKTHKLTIKPIKGNLDSGELIILKPFISKSQNN